MGRLSPLLDMASAARRKRARGLGFDTEKVWYHGTPEQELEEFSRDRVGSRFPQSFGVHMSSSRPEAQQYGSMGGTVGDYVTRIENPLIIDIPQGGLYSTASMKADLDKASILQQVRDEADKGNIHDAVLIRKQMADDWQDWGEVNENLIVFDPEKIRSTRAAFDPEKKHSSNLLAGISAPVTAGLATSALLAPEDAEASFVGEGAQGIYKGIIAAARKMDAAGIPREKIWQDTWDMGGGAYKGPDGKWRVEVDDAPLTVSPLVEGKRPMRGDEELPGAFSDLVQAPHLLAAYPDMADIRLTATGARRGGSYQAPGMDPFGKERITVGARHTKDGELIYPEDTRSIALHELQHAIQDREGFAVGGSPQSTPDIEIRAMLEKHAGLKGITLEQKRKNLLNEPESRRKSAMLESLDDDIRRADKLRRGEYSEDDLWYKYDRLSGEVEARNVEARKDFTPEERRSKLPFATEDYPSHEQITSTARPYNDRQLSALLEANQRSLPPGSRLLLPQGAAPYAEATAPKAGWAIPAAQGIRSGLEKIPPHIRPFIPGEGVADWLEKGAYDELGWWDHVKAGLDFL